MLVFNIWLVLACCVTIAAVSALPATDTTSVLERRHRSLLGQLCSWHHGCDPGQRCKLGWFVGVCIVQPCGIGVSPGCDAGFACARKPDERRGECRSDADCCNPDGFKIGDKQFTQGQCTTPYEWYGWKEDWIHCDL